MAIAITVFCSSVQAQIKKGTHLIGGSLSFGSQKEKFESYPSSYNVKSNHTSISPAWGIAIQDNLVVGTDVLFGQTTTEAGNYKDKNNSYGGGVYIRKYWEVLPRFYVLGQARAGVFSSKYKSGASGEWTRKQLNINVNIVPGVSYAASRNVHVEATFIPLFNFMYVKSELFNVTGAKQSDTKSIVVNTSLNNASNLSLGVRILLGNK